MNTWAHGHGNENQNINNAIINQPINLDEKWTK